jgi:hypothetical protein
MSKDDLIMGIVLGAVAGFIGAILLLSLHSSPPTASASPSLYSNNEVWEWTDWRGRKRMITVHRSVREDA